MNHTNPFPPNPATRLKIQDAFAGCQHPSLFADSLRQNAYTDLAGCIKMVQDQIRDNRALVIDIVGETTVVMVEGLKSNA